MLQACHARFRRSWWGCGCPGRFSEYVSLPLSQMLKDLGQTMGQPECFMQGSLTVTQFALWSLHKSWAACEQRFLTSLDMCWPGGGNWTYTAGLLASGVGQLDNAMSCFQAAFASFTSHAAGIVGFLGFQKILCRSFGLQNLPMECIQVNSHVLSWYMCILTHAHTYSSMQQQQPSWRSNSWRVYQRKFGWETSELRSFKHERE